MIRIVTETGSVAIGLVPGKLIDRLRAGERVAVPGYVDGRGLVHPALWLDFSGGPLSVALLLAGDRVCIDAVRDESGRLIHPHVCLLYRQSNAELVAAFGKLFPNVQPGARFEHASTTEPE